MMTAIYARQSLDKRDSISIETQSDTCRREAQGEEVVIYQDKGFSGKNVNRPDFTRMMEDIRSEKIGRVIVYKLDRISRSVLDFAKLMELFEEYHVEFVSCTEKFDTSNAMGRAMLNIAIVFAQLERETIQMRVADAYYSRSRKGYYMGGRVPYGFRLEKAVIDGIHTSRFIPEPEEMEQIEIIYKIYSQPTGTLSDAMRALIDGGYTEKRWSTARISEIIRNPVYVKADMDVYNFFQSQGAKLVNPASDYVGTNGIFLYKGSDGDGKKKKQYDLRNREAVLAPHNGIIDSGVWLACRLKIMKNRKMATTKKGKRSWLTGKVKCGKCGYAYQVTVSNAAGEGRYFQCSGSRYSIKCKGAGHTIYAAEFEDYIFQRIKQQLAGFEYLADERRRNTPECNDCKIRIAELDQEIDILVSKVAFANDTLMEYINRQIKLLDKEKRELQKRMADFTINNLPPETDRITNFADKWAELEMPDKQRIVDILIDYIKIGEKEIEIFWNI